MDPSQFIAAVQKSKERLFLLASVPDASVSALPRILRARRAEMTRWAGSCIQGLPKFVILLIRHVDVFADGGVRCSQRLEGVGEPQQGVGVGLSPKDL